MLDCQQIQNRKIVPELLRFPLNIKNGLNQTIYFHYSLNFFQDAFIVV